MTNDTYDLDWLAFCYAAGDLNATEAEQFEARLADDQAAREALARAVELTQTIAAAETQYCTDTEYSFDTKYGDLVAPAARTSLDWNRRLSWMAVGGLASLLIAMLWSGYIGPTWHTAHNRLTANSRYQLAMAWNQARDEFAGVREAALWLPLASDADDESIAANMGDDVAEAPSWMTAAVFSVSHETENTNQLAEPQPGSRLENE
jgi:hypothetical protein